MEDRIIRNTLATSASEIPRHKAGKQNQNIKFEIKHFKAFEQQKIELFYVTN